MHAPQQGRAVRDIEFFLQYLHGPRRWCSGGPGQWRQLAARLPGGRTLLGDEKRIAAEVEIERTRENQQIKSEGARPAGIILPLIGRLDDGDVTPVERPCEDTARTGNTGRPLAEAGTQPLRLRQPVLAEIRGASQETITARVLPPVNGLLDHAMI